MKKIQYLSLHKKDFGNNELIDSSDFANPKPFDGFDLVIIDLSDPSIWKCKSREPTSVNCENDLLSLGQLSNSSSKAKQFFIFPQNVKFSHHYNNLSNSYQESFNIKDNLGALRYILSKYFKCLDEINCVYGKTETTIENQTLFSDFYFSINWQRARFFGVQAVCSNDNTSIVAIEYNNRFFVTTLLINSEDELLPVLNQFGLATVKEQQPDWIENYVFNNDKELLLEKEQLFNEKKDIDLRIAQNQLSIDKNSYYKSVLYTNGDELVAVISDILDQILGTNLKEFKDKKECDFIFEEDDLFFLGEIKGITTNVREANVSQTDGHRTKYMSAKEDEQIICYIEKIKAILIINHQKQKPISEREPVDPKVIKFAKSRDVLIIETTTILDIFSKYLKGEMQSDDVLELLKNNNGLLRIK